MAFDPQAFMNNPYFAIGASLLANRREPGGFGKGLLGASQMMQQQQQMALEKQKQKTLADYYAGMIASQNKRNELTERQLQDQQRGGELRKTPDGRNYWVNPDGTVTFEPTGKGSGLLGGVTGLDLDKNPNQPVVDPNAEKDPYADYSWYNPYKYKIFRDMMKYGPVGYGEMLAGGTPKEWNPLKEPLWNWNPEQGQYGIYSTRPSAPLSGGVSGGSGQIGQGQTGQLPPGTPVIKSTSPRAPQQGTSSPSYMERMRNDLGLRQAVKTGGDYNIAEQMGKEELKEHIRRHYQEYSEEEIKILNMIYDSK